ncbi:SirB2 family protein [Arenimonas sp.]|uniref:SirB2 family protein n=1 Tax=Arenimonas sp. TaxID=1872635 RepID=UPI0039E2FCE8
MVVFYTQIKWLHVLCVILSGSLFAVRGLLVLSGVTLGNHAALRWLSYAIDTVLLTAALMLVTILQQYPFVQAWLTVKILLLVAYIVLGIFTLRLARTRWARLICFCSAVVIYLCMAGIARTHDPLAPLRIFL